MEWENTFAALHWESDITSSLPFPSWLDIVSFMLDLPQD